MKLNAEIAGSNHALTLRINGEQLFVQIDEREYELVVRKFPNGGFLLIDGTEVYDCQVGADGGRAGSFSVSLRNETLAVKIIDPKKLRSGQTAGSNDSGEAQIRATMPGKVVRVLVEEGAVVEAAAGIVVVEAMKMQNELKTPKAGTVVKLTAIVGETVNAGDVLAVIE